MAENKRALLEKVFKNEPVERIPIGFWYHYVPPKDHFRALKDEAVYKAVVDGHRKMYEEMKPDFVKIMADGFFGHPSVNFQKIETAEDLMKIKAVGPDHPWIRKQVEYVKEVSEQFCDEVYTFYSIFSPLHCIRLYFEEYEEDVDKFHDMFMAHPEEMCHAAQEVQKDLMILLEELKMNTRIDGIYMSVQMIQRSAADKEFHEKYVWPTDLAVLHRINSFWNTNILHICGYGDYRNDLSLFSNYNAQIINWATHAEQTSLKQGKEFFGNKPVIGGFDNNRNTLLDAGSEEQIEAYLSEVLKEVGSKGVIIGADCTISPEIPVSRFEFIRELGRKYVSC